MDGENSPKKRARAPKKGSEAAASADEDMASALSRIEAALKAQLEAQQRSAVSEPRPLEAVPRDVDDSSDHKSSSERKRASLAAGGGSGTRAARVRGAGGAARALASGGGGAVLAHGDLVYFTLPNIAGSVGLLVGDVKLGRLGVEVTTPGEDRGCGGNPHSEDCAFRLFPKLNYRALRESKAAEKSGGHHGGGNNANGEGQSGAREAAAARLATLVAQEAEQNEELMREVRACAAGYTSVSVCYGDVVQLEHVRSQRFAGLTTEDAARNTNNRRVKLLEARHQESCCYFKVMPQVRARKAGDFVFCGDEVILESVDMDDVALSASSEYAYRRAEDRPDAAVRLPRAILFPRTLEVNGCLLRQGGEDDMGALAAADRRSLIGFRVNLYARFAEGDAEESLTTLSKFRLFFPSYAGYLAASCNRDKGESLDALAKQDRLTRKRENNTPGHLPYLAKNVRPEPSNRANLSAKSVWRFEPLDPLSGDVVAFGAPVRIRHVASNKFLAVCPEAAKRCLADAGGGALGGGGQVLGALGGGLNAVKPLGRRGRKSKTDLDQAEVSGGGDDVEAKQNSVPPPPPAKIAFQDCCLVDAASLAAGGRESVVFSVKAMGVEDGMVPRSACPVRLEHRPAGSAGPHGSHVVLFLSHVDDLKPRLAKESDAIGGGGGQGAAKAKSRCGFTSSHMSGGEVLRLVPCSESEDRLLSSFLGYIPALQMYATRYTMARGEDELPVDMCKPIVRLILDLLSDLSTTKGVDVRDVSRMSIAEVCQEANSVDITRFARLYGSGELDVEAQKLAVDVKLVDALFACILAPYNRTCFSREGGGPFGSKLTANMPSAVHRFLFVAMQRVMQGNASAVEYFCRSSSRKWLSPQKRVPMRWHELLVPQCEDAKGASVLLTTLFKSSAEMVRNELSEDILDKFKELIRLCGPMSRFVNFFASVCHVQGEPIRWAQEACFRKLVMSPKDRYAFGVTFHNASVDAVAAALAAQHVAYPFPSVLLPSGKASPAHVRVDRFQKAPEHYLGRVMDPNDNSWPPVCVVWKSPAGGASWGAMGVNADRGLFWAPKDLGMPTVGPYKDMSAGGGYIGEMVPIELVLWFLEPDRLGGIVGGKSLSLQRRVFSEANLSSVDAKRGGNVYGGKGADEPLNKAARRVKSMALRGLGDDVFERAKGFANYIVNQVTCLAQMCRGRCYNSIYNLEKDLLSYDLLLNMATNPWLPFYFRAEVIHLLVVLFVDRFPQQPKCGAPHLPEQTWIYSAGASDASQNKSTMPVRDPVVGMGHSTKFFLLERLCLVGLTTTSDGRVVHADGDEVAVGQNQFMEALLTAQRRLLSFGFQSSWEKITDLVRSSAEILEGRDDYEVAGKHFVVAERRFEETGPNSKAVAALKVEVIASLRDVDELRQNYILARLLGKFKERVQRGDDSAAIGAWAASREFHFEFDGLFLNGAGGAKFATDAADLDPTVLFRKKRGGLKDVDLYQEALLDAILYQNDSFMAESLHLLESTYTQRRRALAALHDAVLLQHPRVAVYGDVHALRADITEISQLVSTHAVWGVKSPLSGDFDDKKFGKLMNIIDSLLEFIYTPQWEDPDDALTSSAPGHMPGEAYPEAAAPVVAKTTVSTAPPEVVARDLEWAVAAPLEMEVTAVNRVGDDFEKGSTKSRGRLGGAAAVKPNPRAIGEDADYKDDSPRGERPRSGMHSALLPPPEVKAGRFSGAGSLAVGMGAGFKAMADTKKLGTGLDTKVLSSKMTAGLGNLGKDATAGLSLGKLEAKLRASTHFGDAGGNGNAPPPTTAGQRLVAVLLVHLAHEMPDLEADDRVNAFFRRIFAEFDSSSDGLVSYDELLAGIRVILKIAPSQISDTEVELICKQMGEGDGKEYHRGDGIKLEAFITFLEGGGPRCNYRGTFRDCDVEAGQKAHESKKLWSTDVAAKWLAKVRNTGENSDLAAGSSPDVLRPTAIHQQILRACNLQAILNEALEQLDCDVAWKGSKCSVGLKVESQRRLTMVLRALLTLFKGFVADSPSNQQTMLAQLGRLEALATPLALSKVTGVGMEAGYLLDDRLNQHAKDKAAGTDTRPLIEERHFACYSDPDTIEAAAREARNSGAGKAVSLLQRAGGDESKFTRHLSGTFGMSHGAGFPLKPLARWPSSVQEMAQDSILALLRGNSSACMQVAEQQSSSSGKRSRGGVSRRTALLLLAAHEVNRVARVEENVLDKSKAALKKGLGFFRRGLQGHISIEAFVPIEEEYNFTPDTTPMLDFFFVVCSPQRGQFLKEYQAATAATLLDPQFQGFKRWASDCVQRATDKVSDATGGGGRRSFGNFGSLAEDVPDGGDGEDDDEGKETKKKGRAENPYRMVRLLTVLMEGHRETAVLLSQALNIRIDAVCESLVAHLHHLTRNTLGNLGDQFSAQGIPGDDILQLLAPPSVLALSAQAAISALAPDQPLAQAAGAKAAVKAPPRRSSVRAFVSKRSSFDDGDTDPSLVGAEAYLSGASLAEQHETTSETGGAWDLLALLVAMVDELPVSEAQARSPKLWQFVREVVVPAADALSGRSVLSVADHFVAEQLIVVVDRLMAKFHRINIIEELVDDQAQLEETSLADLRDDFLTLRRSPRLNRDLSPHAREAIDRIDMTFRGDGDKVAPMRFPRHQPAKAKVRSQGRHAPAATGKATPGTVQALARGSGTAAAGAEAETVLDQMDAFKNGILANEHIKRGIQRRSFHFVTVLEDGAPRRSGKGFEGSVEVTWDKVVKRLVAFVRGLRFEKNDTQGQGKDSAGHSKRNGTDTCILIFTILRQHLVKARTWPLDAAGKPVRDAAGRKTFQAAERISSLKTVDAKELAPDEALEYAAKLAALNVHGVMELMAQVLIENRAESGAGGGAAADNSNGRSLADEAFEVIVELFRGSNPLVRRKFYRFLVEEDVEGQFFVCIAGRLSASMDAVHRARKAADEARKHRSVTSSQEGLDDGEDVRNDKAVFESEGVLDFANKKVIDTIEFLTNLCQGHDIKFQNFLREQPMYPAQSFDLISMATSFLVEVLDGVSASLVPGPCETRLVVVLLTFLVEAMHGPCEGNQVKVASSDVVVAINSVVSAESSFAAVSDGQHDLTLTYLNVRALSCRVLSACLEGRSDDAAHAFLRRRLNMGMLYDVSCRLHAELKQIPKEDGVRALKLETLAAIWAVHHELFPKETARPLVVGSMLHVRGKVSSSFAAGEGVRDAKDDGGGSDDGGDDDLTVGSTATPAVAQSSGRGGGLSLPRTPRAASDLSLVEQAEADADAVWNAHCTVDSDERDIGVVEVWWRRRVHRVCFPVPAQCRFLTMKTQQKFLDDNRLDTTRNRVKSLLEETDVFLTEMEWVAVIARQSQVYRWLNDNFSVFKLFIYALACLINLNVLMSPRSLRSPWDAWTRSDTLSDNEKTSLQITLVLGLVNALGYVAILLYAVVTTIPATVVGTEHSAQREMDRPDRKQFSDKSAYTPWFAVLFFNAVFMFMHSVNLPYLADAQSLRVYLSLFLGLNLPYLVRCTRHSIVVPINRAQRTFVVVYDAILTKPLFRDHMVFLALSLLGFSGTQYYTFLLLDVVNLTEKLSSLVDAVSLNADSLALVFYVFLTSSLTYASLGITYFPDAFSTTYHGTKIIFKSTLSCFWYLVYNFSSRGSLKGVLHEANPKSAEWMPRIAFDTAFFLWVGIILFTTITALLVDSLGKARASSTRRNDAKTNECFICGLRRPDYENCGLDVAASPSFDDHCSDQHDPWMIVAYMAYLRERDRALLTGVESYTISQIKAKDGFLPSKACHVMQMQGKNAHSTEGQL